MAAWPQLKEVRALLRLQPDPVEDGFIASALAAAIDYGNRRTNYQWPPSGFPPDPGVRSSLDTDPLDLPDAVHEACLFHAARLYRRRDTIDGTIGFGDAGVVRVGRYDADIEALYSSVGPLVFG
jgi:hypothetical protein